MQDGAWCGFKSFDFRGAHTVTATLRGTGAGELTVSTAKYAAPIARIPVRPAADWTDFTAEMTPLQGVYDLFFTYRGTGAVDFSAFEVQ